MAPGPELRCGIVGAGRTRSGLGPFLARHLEVAGGAVVAVSGRDQQRAGHAAAALAKALGHDVSAHGSVEDLLAAERLDALVVAAPVEVHLPALRACLQAGVPVLCEKPLVTAEEHELVPGLIDGFRSGGRLLMENCQWPLVLPAFEALFPGRDGPPREVRMRLSPSTTGRAMLESSLSHLLSVLQALVPVDAETRCAGQRFAGTAGAVDGLRVDWELLGSGPAVRCHLELGYCAEPPRPAWIEIDGARMRREIDSTGGYRIGFVAGERKIWVDDPTAGLVYRFLASVREASSERNGIESDRIEQRARLFHEVILGFDGYLART